MAAVAPAPSAEEAPTADAPSQVPAGAQPASAVAKPAAPAATPTSAATATPAPTTAPPVAAAKAPAAKPEQKSAALAPKPKIYKPGLIPQEADNVDSDGIAATVNDISVSEFEVRQRLALFMATAGVQPNDEEKTRIRGQILDQLENEKLELQEAIKKHITVAPGEVDTQINRMLSDSHITMPQLREVLSNAGSSLEAEHISLHYYGTYRDT